MEFSMSAHSKLVSIDLLSQTSYNNILSSWSPGSVSLLSPTSDDHYQNLESSTDSSVSHIFEMLLIPYPFLLVPCLHNEIPMYLCI